MHLGILAFHFVPAALVDQEGRPVALVGPVGITGIENCSHPLACSCMLGMLVVVVMVMMGDSGMACRLRDRLVALVALVGLSVHLVLICLEGLVSLVALSVQMTLACPLSWC